MSISSHAIFLILKEFPEKNYNKNFNYTIFLDINIALFIQCWLFINFSIQKVKFEGIILTCDYCMSCYFLKVEKVFLKITKIDSLTYKKKYFLLVDIICDDSAGHAVIKYGISI